MSAFVYSIVARPAFPYATFIINISGSFAIGLLAELFDTRVVVSPSVRTALLIGVLGGYTTFSSFSLEILSLVRDGAVLRAFAYAFGSLFLDLAAVWMGVRLAQLF